MTDKLGPLPEPHTRQWINAPFTERLLFTAEQMRAYAAQEVAAERERWAHVFDGWRVLQALTPEQRKRIGYAEVSDVLDAVARLSRA